jgi:hypothetical protein
MEMAYIIGIVIGGVILIVGLGFYFFFKKFQNKSTFLNSSKSKVKKLSSYIDRENDDKGIFNISEEINQVEEPSGDEIDDSDDYDDNDDDDNNDDEDYRNLI